MDGGSGRLTGKVFDKKLSISIYRVYGGISFAILDSGHGCLRARVIGPDIG
jgi:hypothetical protein